MTPPQHRAHLADRVQRLESWAFAAGADVAEIKTAVEQLPVTIRQEILDYTEPVFSEIMAGNATLATRQDLQEVEQRLTEKFERRFDSMDARFDSMDARFEAMDARFEAMDARFDQIMAALGKTAK